MLEGLVLDEHGHHPGCPMHGKSEPPIADEIASHADLFCDCHANSEPMILKNGSDIAWPAGWTEAEATAWREAHDIGRPSQPLVGS